jgi:hypothetical protein
MTERKLREPKARDERSCRAWRIDLWCQDATPAQFFLTVMDDNSAGIVGKAFKKFGAPREVRIDLSKFRRPFIGPALGHFRSAAEPKPGPGAASPDIIEFLGCMRRSPFSAKVFDPAGEGGSTVGPSQ